MSIVSDSIRAIWREFASKPQTYAQIGAGPVNTAVMIVVINIVAEGRWHAPAQQLSILQWLGIIAALTNAVVVIALSRVNVQARGPGNISFDVDTGEQVPVASVQTTTTTQVTSPVVASEASS